VGVGMVAGEIVPLWPSWGAIWGRGGGRNLACDPTPKDWTMIIVQDLQIPSNNNGGTPKNDDQINGQRRTAARPPREDQVMERKSIYATIYHGGIVWQRGGAGPDTEDPWKQAEAPPNASPPPARTCYTVRGFSMSARLLVGPRRRERGPSEGGGRAQ
jgi:hypothetical protein